MTGSTIEVTGSGTSYVATVTGGTGNGAVTLNVEAGAFTNSVGNQNRLTTKTGLTLDNIAPASNNRRSKPYIHRSRRNSDI